MSDTPYTVPKEPGRWRALALAALVHVALLAFVWIGIRWQNETPATVEAEVWSMTAKEAAPRPQPPAPVKPEPEPKPVVKETPKPPPVEEKPVEKPDIALEQEKKRKEEERKRRELEEERRQAELKKRKEEEERQRQEKLAEQKRIEAEKAEKAAKEKKLAEEKKRAEEKKLAEEKRLAEEKKRREEAEQKLLAQARDAEMRRITGGVTGTGGQGSAERSQGGRADAGYLGKVAARIKSNTVFNVPEGLSGNPAVEYAVELLPDGSLRGMPRKLKSSGVPGFDEAVLRAIEKSQPFPRDDRSGSVPSGFTLVHRPKDQ